jgi:excisionase family DNA binding protein
VRRLIARLRDPVIAFDRDLTIVAVNLSTERLFDISASDLIGHDTLDLRPIDLRLREERNRQIREQGFIEGMVECLNPAGDVFAVDLRACRIGMMDTDGIEYLAAMRPVADEPIATADRLRLYTLDEAARLLRKSTRTVRRLLHDGKLAGRKVGGTWRIAESELERVTRPRRATRDGCLPVPREEGGSGWTGDR